MGSVWNTEVDTALIKTLNKLVRYRDEEDVLQTPKIMPRNPQGEFVSKSFPVVTFFNFDQKFATERYSHEDVRIEKDGEVRMEKSAIPYNLHYQIDFWSEYQSDLNEMTRRWVGNFPPRSALEVIDSEGEVRHCVMNFKSFVELEEKREDEVKVFHRAYSYVIWVELDEGITEEVDLVKNEVEIEEVEEW